MTQLLNSLNSRILSYLSQDQLNLLQRSAQLQVKKKGSSVILKDHEVGGVYFVAYGSLGVFPVADMEPVALLKQGEMVGEGILFDEDAHASSTIRAMEDTEVYAIAKKNLTHIFAQDRSLESLFLKGVTASLRDRLHATNDKVRALIASSRIATRNLISPQSFIEQFKTILSEQTTNKNIRASIFEGIIFAMQDISEKTPEAKDTIAAIMDDFELLIRNDRELMRVYYLQYKQTESFLQNLEEIVKAS
jgi:CRP-like cAMP-binding protein